MPGEVHWVVTSECSRALRGQASSIQKIARSGKQDNWHSIKILIALNISTDNLQKLRVQDFANSYSKIVEIQASIFNMETVSFYQISAQEVIC